MKITLKQLKQIIKEEISNLNEGYPGKFPRPSFDMQTILDIAMDEPETFSIDIIKRCFPDLSHSRQQIYSNKLDHLRLKRERHK